MAKVVPLFSGSKGNCYYIGSGNEGVLIDAGRSCRQIEQAMSLNSVDIKNVRALFITHEHIDHCSAVRVLAKKYDLDIYASKGTMDALIYGNRVESTAKLHLIEKTAIVGDMKINRVNTPHDAAESCCYRVTLSDGKTALIATDMGYMTDGVRAAAAMSDFVVLESNHDIEMLKTGPYPYPLKRRILSDKGHLSNEACASELAELVKGGTLRLMLGHLSEQNNTPEIALRTAAAELERAGLKYKNDYTLDIAPAEATLKSVIF